MQKIISRNCPKCNHNQRFYKDGTDKNGFQQYLCRECNHQFTMEKPSKSKKNKYPPCVKCGKATFLHHDYA
ncbi:MAG: IS6 family transposase, partial [Lachnospirales bacterium]